MECKYNGSDRRLDYLFNNANHVEVDPIQTAGNPVADITIDGETTRLYAPAGGGGTDVEANPVGTPTADLDTIRIGQVVYDIPGRGGSGGGQYICDVLYDNSSLPAPQSGTANTTRQYTLTESISNYDAVVVTCMGEHTVAGSGGEGGSIFIVKDDYDIGGDTWRREINNSWGSDVKTFLFGFPTDTTIETHGGRSRSGNEPMLYKVYGLNFGQTAHQYSTSEKIVGTWIDGSAVYEKTIHLNGPYGPGNQSINHNISNLEKIVSMEAYCYYDGTDERLHLPYISLNTNYNLGFSNVNSTRFMLYIGSGFVSVENIDVTFRYTKSS